MRYATIVSHSLPVICIVDAIADAANDMLGIATSPIGIKEDKETKCNGIKEGKNIARKTSHVSTHLRST